MSDNKQQEPKTLGEVWSNSWESAKRRTKRSREKREAVADRIHHLRVTHKLTQRELCEKIDIVTTTYASYEQMKSEIPLDTVVRLCDFYEVSADYLLGRTDEPKGLYYNRVEESIIERVQTLEEIITKLTTK